MVAPIAPAAANTMASGTRAVSAPPEAAITVRAGNANRVRSGRKRVAVQPSQPAEAATVRATAALRPAEPCG